jgi:hypothetical protein
MSRIIRGVIIGIIIGAVVGAIIWINFKEWYFDEKILRFISDRYFGWRFGAAIGATIGAMIGLIVRLSRTILTKIKEKSNNA